MKNFKVYFLITLFFAVLAFGVYLFMDNFVEPKAGNFLTKYEAQEKAQDDVVMVMIDQKSLDKIRWPWKRKLYAQMIEYMNDYGHASVIAHDSFIISPDNDYPESDEYFFNTIKKYDNYIAAFDANRDIDKASRLSGKDLEIFNTKSVFNIEYRKPAIKAYYNSIYKLHPSQIRSASSFGSVVTPVDSDGYIRSALPVLKVGDKNYPMLSFAAAMKHKGIDKLYYDGKYLCSEDGCKTLKIRVNDTLQGLEMGIKWYKRLDEYSTHKTYSAIDVLNSYELVKQGKNPVIAPEEFNNKIVILGAAAAKVKSLEDLKSTPLIERMHAGADIQATVASNALNNEYSYYLSGFQKFAIALLVVLLSIWLLATFNLTASLIAMSILIAGYFSLALFMFYGKNIVMQFITPPVLVLLVASAGFTFRFLLEGKKKEQIQRAMGMYISKDIMKSVVKNIDNLKLGGKRANISVLFADIRGFTSISEKLSAEEVTSILNEYFSAVEPIIRKYNGVLNKFIGDAVLAIFGEPIQDKNHARNAVLCARDMHKAVEQLQEKWDFEGKPHIEIGIAINTGEAFVGNIGSPERIEYTVIGDTVNTASRIEAYNKVYKTRFLISESTYEKVSRLCDVIKIREVSIRGKSKKINIFEVLRVSEENDAVR